MPPRSKRGRQLPESSDEAEEASPEVAAESEAADAASYQLVGVPDEQFNTVDGRRKLRKAYARMSNIIRDSRNTLMKPQGNQLEVRLAEMNTMVDKVHHPREAALDSAVFKEITDIAAKATERTLAINITADEFLGKVTRKVAVIAGWAELGRRAAKFTRTAPVVDFMQGCLEFQPKERKKAQRQARQPLGEQKQPTQVVDPTQEAIPKSATTHRKLQLGRHLSKWALKQPQPLFDVLVNKRSYSESVENVFDFAFLVGSGDAVMSTADGVPMLQILNKTKKNETVVASKQQCIISLSIEEWNEIVHNVDLPEPDGSTMAVQTRGALQDDDAEIALTQSQM